MSGLLTLYFKPVVFVFFVLFVSKSTMTTTTSSSISLKLIHSDLVPKPYDNSNSTLLEHIRRADYSSMARYKYLTNRNTQPSKYDDIQNSLTPDQAATSFYVNISIGEPPIWQSVQIDTGSLLLWVPCYPCKNCPPQSNLNYNPAKSSTYSNISCDSQYCIDFGSCSPTGTCTYKVDYADSSFTRGQLAKEQFTFTTSDDGIITISDFVFGCGHENRGIGVENGILGLGADPLSLVSQMGSKFSYCIGSLRDPNYEYNHLVIGKDANIEGYSTPIKTFHGHYYLTLEGISVGEKRLDIDPKIFIKRSSWDDKGVIIDSGTTISYLARSAYNSLVEEVENLIGELLQKAPVNERLCYEGSGSEKLIGFPVVTFHLAQDADLVVDSEGMFRQYKKDVFCLAVNAVPDSQLNIIGITAQQYYNFGYDLQAMTLSFQRIECELLQD